MKHLTSEVGVCYETRAQEAVLLNTSFVTDVFPTFGLALMTTNVLGGPLRGFRVARRIA